MTVLDVLDETERERLRPAAHPDWAAPMLATLHDEVFSSEAWVYERKLDGQRCLAFRHGERVRLLSRNRQSLDAAHPEVVDGEIVAFEGHLASFARLQPRMQVTRPEDARRSGVTVYYYLFDLLHLDGHDCTRLPLRTRKRLLQRGVDFGDPLRWCSHRNRDGERLHAEACRKGWEGLIAKRADASDVGKRPSDWLELECARRQELVIGGFTDPRGSRVGFGALLVGYHCDGELVYAGKVGTGYDEQTLRALRDRLDRLERDDAPFRAGTLPRREVHWVAPELVAEIAFTEWTGDGRPRHPRFQGLRHDKDARDVVREES